MRKKAFTLIELLTVMAISAILLTLIIIPLVQSFNMTRLAQAFADAQDRARVLTERIAREIGVAASVRSGASQVTTVYRGNTNAKLPQHSIIVEVPGKDGNTVEIALPYSKIDIVLPAEGEPLTGPGGGYINPATGMEDPTMTGPKGQVNVPVVPGQTIVRFFIGRKDPFRDYNNPYDGQLMARNGQEDNLYVLYRAEVQPYLSGGSVNTLYFDTDTNGRAILDDPRFFTPNRDISTGKIITNDAHAERIKNWLGLGSGNAIVPGNATRRAVIMTEMSRYDMILARYNQEANSVVYDGNFPRLVSLIQFRPSHVTNEPAEGQVASRQGEETSNSVLLASSVYKTKFGLWDYAIIRNWPKGWDPSDSARNAYNVAHGDARNGDPGFPPGMSIYVYDPDLFPNDFDNGMETFDMFSYEQRVSLGQPYAFGYGTWSADQRSGWLGSSDARATFVPFTINTQTGKIRCEFGISEVGNWTVTPPATNPQNLPSKDTCLTDPYTPFTDPDTSGNFYDAKHDPVNEKFNKVWVDYPNLQPNVHRYIDLRVTPNADGTMGPMHPTTGFSRCTIVPGSEEVYGPDQLPGPNYGATIRYTRTTRTPGPNQYRFNYVDLPEPRNQAGNIDYTLVGLTPAQTTGFNPNVYNPQNFVSAVIQPRFKKGYLQLNSDPNVALAPGSIMVSYRFQFTGAGSTTGNREDVFAVDYDTRQLIDVVLTMRNYPQTTAPNSQSVTLKSTAAVRNYVR